MGTTALQSAAEQAKSIDDVIAAQEKAISAQRDFAANTKEVLDEVGQEGVEWAETFGPLAPKMMQLLADAPKKKQKEIIANYRRAGVRSPGPPPPTGSTRQEQHGGRCRGGRLQRRRRRRPQTGPHQDQLQNRRINITDETRIALINAQRYADRHPVTYHVNYAPSGQKPQRDIL